MSQPAPLTPLPEPSGSAPARHQRQLEVWFDLLERLAERKEKHESGAVQPPTRAQVWLDKAVWQIIRFARWLRPHLSGPTRSAARQGQAASNRVYGWLLWQLRLLRTDADRRLAVISLAGGFFIPLGLIILLSYLIPPAEQLQPYIDPSVPVPSAEFIAEEEASSPVEVPNAGEDLEPAPALPPMPANSNDFRFENFAQRDEHGNLRLLNHAAENNILAQFPIGTPAVKVMRFFGEVMLHSGSGINSSPALAAQARCMSMPVNKLFVVKTVTCTYGHDLPAPRLASESPRSRVFWILALSYDNKGMLIDLRLHARTTLAAP